MKRRQFITTGIAVTGGLVLTGRGGANVAEPVATDEIPRYADWIPAGSYDDADRGVFFTHFDWEMRAEPEDVEDDVDDDVGFDDPDVEPIIESYPILGLPLFGSSIAPSALFGIVPYPFAEEVVPDGPPTEGIATTAMTWVDDALVFHGEFEPAVFDEWYAEDFELDEEREGFGVYVGDAAATDGLAYAVSEDALVVALTPDADAHTGEDAVTHLLDGFLGDADRVIDDEDGAWLFEATGEPSIALGAWELPDPENVLDPDGPEEGALEAPAEGPEVEANPAFDGVESLVNTIAFGTDDDPDAVEAHYAGLYRNDAVPAEGDVRRHLVGGAFVPHDLAVEGNRVYARVTFEDDAV